MVARHRKVSNQRKDFHYKTACTLVENNDLIAVEDLAIVNMLRRASSPRTDPDQSGSCRTGPQPSPG